MHQFECLSPLSVSEFCPLLHEDLSQHQPPSDLFSRPFGEPLKNKRNGIKQLSKSIVMEMQDSEGIKPKQLAYQLYDGVQNLKSLQRRVYDTLTILLGLGVVSKKQKRYTADPLLSRVIGFRSLNVHKEQTVAQLRKQFNQLQLNLNLCAGLQQRNKALPDQASVKFPVVGVLVGEHKAFRAGQQRLLLQSKTLARLISDVECLKLLNRPT